MSMEAITSRFPHWQSPDGSVLLIHGDCLEVLPMIEAGSVDAVVTDPPYEVHAGHGGGVFGERDHLVKTGGFTDCGVDYRFLGGFKNWFCFCSRRQLPALIAAAMSRPRWNLITWCKPNPVPTCCNKYLPDVEYVVHAFGQGNLFGDMADKSCFSVIPCGNKETDHPNEKPLSLVARLVRLGTTESQLILDPFMGSGTTGVACIRTGRRFIGVELDPCYYQIAIDRCQRELEAKTGTGPLYGGLLEAKP